jgi:3'-phosphoadenosine 5'-phosphosulfate sulfotransferase (PAPS reductase)/FAD synthetase
MPKIKLDLNVYEAARQRIEWTFDNFDKIYLSFSGGKDSTVMLHMVMDEAIKRNKEIGLLIVDLEGQYKLTINHMLECVKMYRNYIDLYWVCLPIHLRNAVSVFEPFWLCWDENKKNDWIREQPKFSVSDINYFPFFRAGMEFEEFVPEFGEWYSNGKNTACLVGIRADESLNRFRTIASNKKVTYLNKQYTTKVTNNVFNVYPIYDWSTEDIWIYHGKNKDKRHNELYDLMHKAGLSIHLQRICQPYGDDQRKGLWLFHLIEPETWSKVVARVNGANSGALYVQDTGNINGYGKITKPENHTWKSFSELILNTLPEKTAEHYKNKIFVFIKWWQERGYDNEIPDYAPNLLESQKLVPSWRRICKSLLRNDWWCKGLGFTQHKTKAYEKYLKLKKQQREEEKFKL